MLGNLMTSATNMLIAVLAAAAGAMFWAVIQRKRELHVEASDEFYKIYADFFAYWKFWDAVKTQRYGFEFTSADRMSLLEKVASAEARMEALLVRSAMSRRLNNREIEALGRFRQSYQVLRERIRQDRPLQWSSSDHPEYERFKKTACEVACIVSLRWFQRQPAAKAAAQALLGVTSNKWEDKGVLGRVPAPPDVMVAKSESSS